MHTCVHLLLHFASRLLLLALRLQHKTCQWRGAGCVCPGPCPQLLLPAATTSTRTGAAAWFSRWDQELLASQGLSSAPQGGGRRPLLAPTPGVLLFTVMMLGRQQGQGAAERWPLSAGSGRTASGRWYPTARSRRMEKALSFLRNVFVFSLRAEELCPSPSGTGPPSSKSVVQ